jgi:hypothetical protein
MLHNGKPLKKLTQLASCALCCLAAAAAVANPPAGNNAGGLLARATGMLGSTSAHTPAPASRVGFQSLDLRPPETLPGAHAPGPIGEHSAAFPSAKHEPSATSTGVDEDLPGNRNWTALRMESKVHEMERRVPHEGLPVARLWETKTALLHVGLNPRGKPGLWLIQKVP